MWRVRWEIVGQRRDASNGIRDGNVIHIALWCQHTVLWCHSHCAVMPFILCCDVIHSVLWCQHDCSLWWHSAVCNLYPAVCSDSLVVGNENLAVCSDDLTVGCPYCVDYSNVSTRQVGTYKVCGQPEHPWPHSHQEAQHYGTGWWRSQIPEGTIWYVNAKHFTWKLRALFLLDVLGRNLTPNNDLYTVERVNLCGI